METYDQNGSEIQPHRVTSTHGRDHHHLSKDLSFETKKGSAWQVTLTDSAFAKTSKASFQCCRLAWINVLTVTGSQNWRIVATQRERWKAAAHAARLPAAPEAGGTEPHSQSFPESRWRGLRSGCLCLRFGVSVNLEVHSKEKMILREHLLQSDICPKHLMFFSSQMALLRKLWFSFMLQWLSSAEKIYSPEFVTWTHSLTTHGRTGNPTFPRPVSFWGSKC